MVILNSMNILISFLCSGVIVILFVFFMQKRKKKKGETLKEGVLLNYFFLPCYSICMIICVDYFKNVVFKYGAFPPRSDDIIYLFMLLFSIKGQIDIITFIRNAKRDLKQEAMK